MSNPQPESNPSSKRTQWSLSAALGAAVAASACCTIPLALVSLGVGGAWISGLTALEPYRWVFITLAAGALGYAGYNEWLMSRRLDCACETSFLSPAARRSLLGVSALAIVALIVSPWLLGASPSAAGQGSQAAASWQADAAQGSSNTPASFQQVVLEVEGMTCATCPITVRKALEGTPGVYDAAASGEPPQAVVRFDPAQTSVEALTQATRAVGFPSQAKSPS